MTKSRLATPFFFAGTLFTERGCTACADLLLKKKKQNFHILSIRRESRKKKKQNKENLKAECAVSTQHLSRNIRDRCMKSGGVCPYVRKREGKKKS